MLSKLLYIPISIFGAIINRIRGGLEINNKDIPVNKIWQPIFYGIFLSLFIWNTNLSFILILYFALIQAIAMYTGQQICGWGAYKGAIFSTDKNYKIGEENKYIDSFLNSIKIKHKGNIIWVLSENPVLWGFCGLAIRGLIWTFFLGLNISILTFILNDPTYIFKSIYLILFGLTYPVYDLVAKYICMFFNKHQNKNAWNLGEYLWGAAMWSFILYLIKFL